MKYIFLCLIIFSNLGAEESDCNLLDSTLEYPQLKCLNKNIIATEIRRNFIEVQKRNDECKSRTDCAEVFPDATKFLNLVKKKFLVIGLKQNGFGGNFVFLFFRSSKMIHRVWVYPIDENIYQVRELKTLAPSKTFQEKISYLNTNSKIESLWL